MKLQRRFESLLMGVVCCLAFDVFAPAGRAVHGELEAFNEGFRGNATALVRTGDGKRFSFHADSALGHALQRQAPVTLQRSLLFGRVVRIEQAGQRFGNHLSSRNLPFYTLAIWCSLLWRHLRRSRAQVPD